MANQLQSDRFYVGGVASVAVPVVEGNTPVTMNVSNVGITDNGSGYTRSGNVMAFRGRFTSTGVGSAALFSISIPDGLTSDMPHNAGYAAVGHLTINNIATSTQELWPLIVSSSSDTEIYLGLSDVNFGLTPVNANNTFVGVQSASFEVSIPITEWQSQALIGTTKEATATESGLVYKPVSDRVSYTTGNLDTTSTTLVDLTGATITLTLATPGRVAYSFIAS